MLFFYIYNYNLLAVNAKQVCDLFQKVNRLHITNGSKKISVPQFLQYLTISVMKHHYIFNIDIKISLRMSV